MIARSAPRDADAPVAFALATPDDVPALARLHADAAAALTARHGEGRWSSAPSERAVAAGLRDQPRFAQHWLARRGERLAAAFTLQTRKPWAIDRAMYPIARFPLYCTGMVVAPSVQGSGMGRRCVEEMIRVAADWPADAIRLDAWDHAAGAGRFYERCGFREVGRKAYRGNPLVYFELRLVPTRAIAKVARAEAARRTAVDS